MKAYRRFRITLCAALSVLTVSGVSSAVDPLPERPLQLDGEISEEGSQVRLTWPKSTQSKVGRITIQRRVLGETFKSSWLNIDSTRSFARLYVDEKVRPGVAYEYRVTRPGLTQFETGYWVTGREVPAEENRGIAIVLVDETLADRIEPSLERFLLDLAGDGWQPVRHDVARGNDKDPVENLKAARKIRDWIKTRYYLDSSMPHALILVGHVPVVKSGRINPDGHEPRPQETDLFYADMNGIWRDDGQGVLAYNSLPSDHIEMQVGRIDFSALDATLGDEVSLLKRYFDKNHEWRHGRLGDLRRGYGNNTHLAVENNALRNIVGPDAVEPGGHHDAGTRQPWLMGLDFGSHKYQDYTTSTPITAVFTLNFGSGKLNFSRPNNTMKIMLAQAGYTLTTGWGGRPAWQLHHMALGKSIGYSHLRTVNNGTATFGGPETLEYVPTGNYTFLNSPWVNLLGDPTLRPFPLASVEDLRARTQAGEVHLDWRAPAGESQVRYRIYRASDRFGPYRALNPSELHVGTRFVDPDPPGGAWYMVRAHALKEVYAGSFYRFSQGAFVAVDE